MPITKQVVRQRDWSMGQLDASAVRRDDLKFYKQAARTVTNLRPLPTGGLTRRPGRSIVYFDGGRHDIVRPHADATFDVTFAALRFTARLRSGAIVSSLVAPWTEDMLAELSWVPYGRRIYVTHKDMTGGPRVLEYDRDAGTWSISTYAFRTNLDGTIAVPFYRFANFGETLQPSALTGTITLTASADVFEAGHVGVVFDYGGRQVKITAVTDTKHATALCLQDLPSVWRVTVSGVAGFKVGEVVIGDTSNSEGEIMAIGANTLDIFTTKNWGADAWGGGDTVVGSEASASRSASTTAGPSNAATVQWREQFMSDIRGWPGSVSQGFSRLSFCDFDQLENAIAWSAIDEPDNFKLGGKAADAMLETVPTVCRVLHVAGTADLFVLTDKSAHYIPVSAQNPLAPGGIEFRPLGTAGSARVKPVEVGDGLVFIGATLPLVWAISPTGTQTRPYEVKKLNGLAQTLFNAPVAIAASEGQSETNPEQHLFVVNADGTVRVGHGNITGDLVGWFPWDGRALVTDVAAREGDVIFTCRYTLDDLTVVDTVEAIDATRYLDGALDLEDFAGNDPLSDSGGEAIEDSTGAAINAASGALVPFANATLQAWDAAGYYIGDVTVDAAGRVDISGVNLSAVALGWKFTPTLVPFLEAYEGGDDLQQSLRRRKIAKASATVQESHAFTVDGKVVGSYRVGEDWSLPPPARDGSYRWRQAGRSDDPSVTISQPTPGKFTLVEFGAEITV